MKQMAEREGVTEQLKAQDQMLWVQRMNNKVSCVNTQNFYKFRLGRFSLSSF